MSQEVDRNRGETAASEPGPARAAFPGRVWVRIAVLAVLFVALHERIIRLLFHMASTDPDWSHALLVPFISLFLIHHRRDALRLEAARVCWWGLPLLLAGMAVYPFGIYLHSSMVMGYAMVVELFGLTLLLVGPALMRVLWLPVVYLVFGVKITLFWDPLTLSLQRLAAFVAAVLISLIGLALDLEADVMGSVIQLYKDGVSLSPPLNVDEACSGLRMLMALIALGTAMAYLSERPGWARMTVVIMTVPTAIAVNVARVTAMGVVFPYWPGISAGQPHQVTGLLMLLPALGCLWLAGRLCDWVAGTPGPGLLSGEADLSPARAGDGPTGP